MCSSRTLAGLPKAPKRAGGGTARSLESTLSGRHLPVALRVTQGPYLLSVALTLRSAYCRRHTHACPGLPSQLILKLKLTYLCR